MAVYVTVAAYDPDGTDASAHTPYHTVVSTAGVAGLDEEATAVGPWLLAGTFANVTPGTLPLFWDEVGPLPKPPRPSTL